MQTADSLRLWSWHLFTSPEGYNDPTARAAALAQKEHLAHHRIKETTYKLFLQAILHAGADDPNLEFSLSVQTIVRMTGLAKLSVVRLLEAAQLMGHIVYTGRVTAKGNPHRRTKIYRICALDQPEFVYGFQPQLLLCLEVRDARH